MKTTEHCLKKLNKSEINGMISQVHGLKDLIVKTAILPQVTYIFNVIPIKFATALLQK